MTGRNMCPSSATHRHRALPLPRRWCRQHTHRTLASTRSSCRAPGARPGQKKVHCFRAKCLVGTSTRVPLIAMHGTASRSQAGADWQGAATKSTWPSKPFPPAISTIKGHMNVSRLIGLFTMILSDNTQHMYPLRTTTPILSTPKPRDPYIFTPRHECSQQSKVN